MRLHRFFTGNDIKLKHDFWLHEPKLLWQWRRVLRYKEGQEVVLFDGVALERLYKIESLSEKEAHLVMITDFVRKTPKKEIYLLWSLLKKDKNDWVLQKATELGVSHFVPLMADRSEKTGFNLERAQKIIIEASEQCGRGDIPSVREPMHLETAVEELKSKVSLIVCEQSEKLEFGNWNLELDRPVGILVGPEGGWSPQELELFKAKKLKHLDLHDFTLRAETACVTAINKLVYNRGNEL